MARKVDRVRPRNERDISTDEFELITQRQPMTVLERVRPDDRPRRLNGAGYVVVGCVVACLVFYVLGYIGASHWWHQ